MLQITIAKIVCYNEDDVWSKITLPYGYVGKTEGADCSNQSK